MKKLAKNTRRLYIAYGSNLNIEQMGHRCPYAVPLGTAMLENYRLMFRGGNNAVATVEPLEGCVVPVLLWEITPRCEEALDRYEGWPRLYRKEDVTVTFGGKPVAAMVYIMNEVYPYGQPGDYYLDVIKDGYATAGFDTAVLNAAIADSMAAMSMGAICKVCKQYMLVGDGCLPSVIECGGKTYQRIKVGGLGDFFEGDTEGTRCGDCGAKVGHYHHSGCDCERCPVCKRQLLSCCCIHKVHRT